LIAVSRQFFAKWLYLFGLIFCPLVIVFLEWMEWSELLGAAGPMGPLLIGAVSCVTAPWISPGLWKQRLLRFLLGTALLIVLWYIAYALLMVYIFHAK
jgi:hypothetical protein